MLWPPACSTALGARTALLEEQVTRGRPWRSFGFYLPLLRFDEWSETTTRTSYCHPFQPPQALPCHPRDDPEQLPETKSLKKTLNGFCWEFWQRWPQTKHILWWVTLLDIQSGCRCLLPMKRPLGCQEASAMHLNQLEAITNGGGASNESMKWAARGDHGRYL